MKKTLSIIIALVMLLGLAIPVSADTVVTFTFEPEAASYNAGDDVRIAIEIASTVKANSFGLSDFTYNTDVFEFVGFDDDDEGDLIATIGFNTMDDDNQIATAGVISESGRKVNGTFAHVNFKVKSTAPTGSYTISAIPLVKLNTTELGSAVVPATISVTASSGHSHSYGAWTYVDATNHKKSCECGEDDIVEAHTWNSGVVTTEATTKAEGEKTYTCTVCGGTKTEVIPRVKVVLEENTDIEEVKDSYVNATAKAITVDDRTITGSNVFVTSAGQIRVDAGENAKVARDNGDETTSQGFIFGVANPSGVINVVFEFEGTAKGTDYTGKTVTRAFDFTGSEISLANFGYAIVNIPKPLVVTVKAE